MNFLFLCTHNACRSILSEAAHAIQDAFERTYQIVLARTHALFALPLAQLADPQALKQALDRIGASVPGEDSAC